MYSNNIKRNTKPPDVYAPVVAKHASPGCVATPHKNTFHSTKASSHDDCRLSLILDMMIS